MDTKLTINPIGFVRCDRKYKGETPRQSVDAENEGRIELAAGRDFEAALEDLAGFDRIWVIFGFHLNFDKRWRVKTAPPVTNEKKRIGVFATRSPYRPNPLGTSCVELTDVEGRNLYIKNFDMLDGTPVYDIKPYIPRCDAFADSATGWLPEFVKEYRVEFTDKAFEQAEMVQRLTNLDLVHFAKTQLGNDPFNQKRKRIEQLEGAWTLSCRTWRLWFDLEDDVIRIRRVTSNYSSVELALGSPDKYGDKEAHRQFQNYFRACD